MLHQDGKGCMDYNVTALLKDEYGFMLPISYGTRRDMKKLEQLLHKFGMTIHSCCLYRIIIKIYRK